jgi:medium-chain acyl-[acyl-carrier-protein] hydrolase
MTRNAWFINLSPSRRPLLRLFCFPYAGGSAAVFRELADALPEDIGLWAANLPGRGSRLQHAPLAEMEPLVALLAQALPDEQPFAFLGYSLGGRLAFEVVRALRRQGRTLPEHLFVAAASAPHLPPNGAAWHTLPEPDLLAELRQYNGVPEVVMNEPEILALLLPALRADLTMSATAVYTPERPLLVPITALGGRRDPLVSGEALAAWRDHTSGRFRLKLFDGDHFFFRAVKPELLAGIISTEIGRASVANRE